VSHRILSYMNFSTSLVHAVLTQPDSNNAPDNIQVKVAKPEVEGGTAPREEDPQPDGVASSKDADFVKVESE